ncbi:MAG: stage II sporulation protein M [Solirubrobacterales bacterium]
MDASQYAFVHGMRRTRATLERWCEDPWAVLGSWLAGAAAIGVLLLAAVVAIASSLEPDIGFHYMPSLADGPEAERVAHIVGANSLVLALHAVACVAGFIAGSALPLSAARRRGVSRWVHERARPVALGWVVLVTAFSLITQAVALGIYGTTLAYSAGVSPAVLVLTVLPHALLELTAVFLPLAAWTIASRRDDWDQLLAATAVTVTVAIPMLIASAVWEVHVWPLILRGVSPLA